MLSIVIVSYNTRDLLDQCLASIESHCSEAEVIVVDNDSHDGSPAMVREKYPFAKLVCSTENLGFACARNLGIREATQDYVALLHSDTALEDDSLSRCIDFMQSNQQLGAVSPRLMGADEKRQVACYAFPSLRTHLSRVLLRHGPTRIPDPNEDGWLVGTALLIRREALTQIGGYLDQDYGMYWEDADICARLLAAGWNIREIAEAHVRHYGDATGNEPEAVRHLGLCVHYAWGEHCWFSKHRPIWESIAVWLLDAFDMIGLTFRGLLGTSKRMELTRARVLVRVLACRLFRLRPSLPVWDRVRAADSL